ncbi:hypothetical protein J3R30DRAFT_3657519 [Lentinula aciculospora]|uniref:Uncharacterized protein n=1 Tax=Lentinula aciculospora TaxID=153920 RepID=A0A9W9DN25_9AGAR|nr:hypothetical protein J3R30DRAFT_3657519 [Lentinula aciculospora]
MEETGKIPLPMFIKALTSHNISVTKAMTITKAIYKEYNTPAKLYLLTDLKLKASGIEDKEDRTNILAAMRRAGYITGPAAKGKKSTSSDPSSSSITVAQSEIDLSTPSKKRKRNSTDSAKSNKYLPLGEGSEYQSLEFNEVLDESILQLKATIVNRAPLMTAWATVVAERMGFRREEALSIASSYTEMNALSKGVSLGIFKEGKQKGLEAAKGGAQPYVDLMGRRPLYQIQNNCWRALHNGTPTQPSTAYSYISRSLRQTMPFIMGALRLLANSFTPQEINQEAWGLYTQFRPAGEGWGERSEVRCTTILALKKLSLDGSNQNPAAELEESKAVEFMKSEAAEDVAKEDRESKRFKRGMTLEEYETMLDEDHTFDGIDLDNLPSTIPKPH